VKSMMKQPVRGIFGCLLPASSLCLVAAQPALAQEAQGLRLEEIIVTARQRAESELDVPLSLRTLDAETLERAAPKGLEDIATLVPGLTYNDGIGQQFARPTLRGMSQSVPVADDNNVSVFVDGVYVPARQGIDMALFDVERIEVVRGPQSALYGRNSFAGAINYITRQPSEQTAGRLSMTAGDDGRLALRAGVEGSLTGDGSLTGRISGLYDEFDGSYDNAGGSDGIGSWERKGLSGTLAWNPSDSFQARLSVLWADDFYGPQAVQNVANNCQLNEVGLLISVCGTLPAAERDEISAEDGTFALQRDLTRTALTLDYTFANDMTLTSITSYTGLETDNIADHDGTADGSPFAFSTAPPSFGFGPFPVWVSFLPPGLGIPGSLDGFVNLNTYATNNSLERDDFTQEFRLSSASDGPLQWLAGVFLSRGTENVRAAAGINSTNLPEGSPLLVEFLGARFGIPGVFVADPRFTQLLSPVERQVFVTESEQTITNMSVFGQVSYDISERLTVSAEARYTREKKEFERILDAFFGNPPEKRDETWTFTDPRFTLDYDLAEDWKLYASAARGTLAGGFTQFYSLNVPEESSYDPERNWTYEIGAKGLLFDGRAQLDFSAFYVDWSDPQILSRSEDPAFTNSVIRNLSGITNSGLEVSLSARVTEGLSVFLGYAYANPEFDSGTIDNGLRNICIDDVPGIEPTCTLDVSGNQLPQSSQHTATVSADYRGSLSATLDWFARLDVGYRSSQYTNTANVAETGDRTLSNLRLGLGSTNWDLTFFVDNLFDEDTPQSLSSQPLYNSAAFPRYRVINIQRRQLGATLNWNF
jgi:iron complex outermembrane receptor protein